MTIEPILHSFAYALDFLREQVRGLDAAQMVVLPAGIANHPAWTIGHLTFTCQMLGSTFGMPEFLPQNFAARFGSGSVPTADPRAYPALAEALATLDDAQRRLSDAVRVLSEAQLDMAFPDPSYRHVFPTIRHALTQVLVGHAAFHVGQISVWRKAMGLPPLPRSYE